VAAFEAWLVLLILVVNVVGELQRKRTLAASRGFLAAARLSCYNKDWTGRLEQHNGLPRQPGTHFARQERNCKHCITANDNKTA